MTPSTIPTINPEGIYDDALLNTVLGVSPQTLKDARHKGELRYARKGKRTLYLGQWVLAWLMAESGKESANAPSR